MHLADVPSQAADSRVIPVGNGPFRMTSWTSTTMEFEASDTWIGRRGNVRRVEVDTRPLVEARGPLRYYDLVQDPAEHADQVLDGDLIVANRLHETSLLAFAARTGPWSDVNVRRALAVSIDRTVLDMDRDGVPADGGLIPPSLLGHAHHAALPYDPELAAELLAQAGHPGGAGLPVLRLVTWSAWLTTRSTFDELRRMWGDLGIDLEVRGVAFGHEMTGAEGVDAYATGWVADYPDPAGMLGSFLAVYPGFVLPTDPRAQQLLTDIRLSQTRNERIDRYRSLDRLLVSELVALVPLAYGSASCLVRPWVHGYWRTPIHVSTADEVTVVGRPARGPGAVHGLIAHSGEGQLASE
jgi:ABC-type transport system substrate-binding protein